MPIVTNHHTWLMSSSSSPRGVVDGDAGLPADRGEDEFGLTLSSVEIGTGTALVAGAAIVVVFCSAGGAGAESPALAAVELMARSGRETDVTVTGAGGDGSSVINATLLVACLSSRAEEVVTSVLSVFLGSDASSAWLSLLLRTVRVGFTLGLGTKGQRSARQRQRMSW